MSNTIFAIRNPVIDGVQYSQEDLLKKKFELRKKYDKLRLISKQKEKKLIALHEDLAMLLEAGDCTELDSQSAQDSLHALEMKLNTVTIKINEAERNRKTYELN